MIGAVLGAADVALAEDERRADIVADEALERRELVGAVQVVRIETFRMLAPVHPCGARFGTRRIAEIIEAHPDQAVSVVFERVARSEERAGGKECGRTCRSRCSPISEKHNTN